VSFLRRKGAMSELRWQRRGVGEVDEIKQQEIVRDPGMKPQYPRFKLGLLVVVLFVFGVVKG